MARSALEIWQLHGNWSSQCVPLFGTVLICHLLLNHWPTGLMFGPRQFRSTSPARMADETAANAVQLLGCHLIHLCNWLGGSHHESQESVSHQKIDMLTATLIKYSTINMQSFRLYTVVHTGSSRWKDGKKMACTRAAAAEVQIHNRNKYTLSALCFGHKHVLIFNPHSLFGDLTPQYKFQAWYGRRHQHIDLSTKMRCPRIFEQPCSLTTFCFWSMRWHHQHGRWDLHWPSLKVFGQWILTALDFRGVRSFQITLVRTIVLIFSLKKMRKSLKFNHWN